MVNFYILASFIFKLNSWTLSISILSNLFPSFHLEGHALMVIKKFIATVNRPFHAFQINQSNYCTIPVQITGLVVSHEDEQYIKENNQ